MSMMEQLGLFCAPENKSAEEAPTGDSSWHRMSFFAIDVETTGLDAASNRVIELAMIPFNFGPEVATFGQLFAVDKPLPPEITRITGITDAMLADQPRFHEKANGIVEELSKASFILAYNAKFDRPFLESELARCDLTLPDLPWVDPFVFVCELDKYKKGKKLGDAAARWGIDLTSAHRAVDDARAAGLLMLKMADKIAKPNLADLLRHQKIMQWRHDQEMAEYRRANLGAVSR